MPNFTIPYPLYLRCIMTYADKYDILRYSIYRLYRDIRRKAGVDARIGGLYPNVLDHVVLDDDDVDAKLIKEVTRFPLVEDAAASIQRFASRCFAADKSEMMVMMISQAIRSNNPLPKPIVDVLLFYGAKLDPNDDHYFNRACLRGTCMNDDVERFIENGHHFDEYDVCSAIESGNCDTIKLLFCAYRGRLCFSINLLNATVQSMELCMSLNIIERGKHHYSFSNIPSFSVLQWILDHDVMEHDRLLIDIAFSASRYSGHYFDMLRYLIEQRNFTVPRDVLIELFFVQTTDLDVFDHLLLHGADVDAVDQYGRNVLERSPMLIRYWIDKELAFQSNGTNTLKESIRQDMTVPVLEMMIDKYSMDVNVEDDDGVTALHHACHFNRFEVVEMLIKHGADVNKRHAGKTPYEKTSNDRIKQLFIQNGYKP